MILINPLPHSAIVQTLGELIHQLPDPYRNQLHRPSDFVEQSAPFVELAYHEITDEELEKILNYSGITEANGPIGIDCRGASIFVGDSPDSRFLFYPLNELESYIRRNQPEIVHKYDQLGGMDELVDALGEEMSASEYLTGGLLDCLRYCKEKQCGLSIRW
jgi:hypothetical protein